MLENIQKIKKIESISIALISIIFTCKDFDQEHLNITNSLKEVFESQESKWNEYAKILMKFSFELAYMKHFNFLNDIEKESEQWEKLIACANELLVSRPIYNNSDSQNLSNQCWFIGKISFNFNKILFIF